jgi:hypothetical protein
MMHHRIEESNMTEKEGYFIDYIAIGVLGFAIGQAIASIGGFQTQFSGLISSILGIDWGRTIGSDVITGIFAFLPAGFVAGYLCYKLLKAEGKMEGLTGGFMSFLAYLIITLIITLAQTGIWGGDFGTAMELWVVLMVFALIFFPIGGFLAGMMHGMKTPMPSFLRLQFLRGAPTPPPPPGTAAQTCPTCGSPLRYIQQYQRWYCDKEQKYA